VSSQVRIGTELLPNPEGTWEMTPVMDGLHFANSVTVGGFEGTGEFTTVYLDAAMPPTAKAG
jgi:hypothetical protein